MTAIEIALLLIGVVFIIGSFFIIEKLSPEELSRVSELSEDELRIVMDRELATAGAKISDVVDQTVDLSINQIQRRMEKDITDSPGFTFLKLPLLKPLFSVPAHCAANEMSGPHHP